MNASYLPYQIFSEVYEQTMAHVNFTRWAVYIKNELQANHIPKGGNILELGCGTGIIAAQLSMSYPRYIATDISLPMLRKTKEKRIPMLASADMRKLPFASNCFAAVVSTHDVLNYLPSLHDLKEHFHEVNRVLMPGGVYIFDITSEQNVKNFFHNQTIEEDYPNLHLIWENYYDAKNREIISTLTFRDKKMATPKVEIHRQKIFSEKTMQTFFRETNFRFIKKSADYDEKHQLKRARLIVYTIRKKRFKN